MDASLYNIGLALIDFLRYAVLTVFIILATFFIYSAILYRIFLSSRQDVNLLDLPGYPFFSYMILKQGINPATILNRMPEEKIEKTLKSFPKQFGNVTVHCEDKKMQQRLLQNSQKTTYTRIYISTGTGKSLRHITKQG